MQPYFHRQLVSEGKQIYMLFLKTCAALSARRNAVRDLHPHVYMCDI